MKKRAYNILALAAILLLSGACRERTAAPKRTIYVTIAPLTEIVAGITGDDFEIATLVPAGASPETFEPTPRQIMALTDAQAVFSVGLIDFETAIASRLDGTADIVDLSRGIDLIAGSCTHRGHAHGTDPHVWTSPRGLLTMASNAYEAVRGMYPDSAKYEKNYLALRRRIEELDRECAEACAASPHRSFVIFHPALTYFARDYGIEQIAVEHEGKEPTARRLGRIVDRARSEGLRRVFYQSQFPKSTVEAIAGDIGAECVAIDPLAPDAIDNIRRITNLITQ